MGWQQLLVSPVDSLAWPVIIGLLVVLFLVLFRKPLGHLIEHGGIKVGIGSASVEIWNKAEIEAAAAALAPSLTGQLSQAESQAEHEWLDATVATAKEELEKRRRADIERLIAASMQEGWVLARTGLHTLPRPSVAWDDSGKPTILYAEPRLRTFQCPHCRGIRKSRERQLICQGTSEGPHRPAFMEEWIPMMLVCWRTLPT